MRQEPQTTSLLWRDTSSKCPFFPIWNGAKIIEFFGFATGSAKAFVLMQRTFCGIFGTLQCSRWEVQGHPTKPTSSTLRYQYLVHQCLSRSKRQKIKTFEQIIYIYIAYVNNDIRMKLLCPWPTKFCMHYGLSVLRRRRGWCDYTNCEITNDFIRKGIKMNNLSTAFPRELGSCIGYTILYPATSKSTQISIRVWLSWQPCVEGGQRIVKQPNPWLWQMLAWSYQLRNTMLVMQGYLEVSVMMK